MPTSDAALAPRGPRRKRNTIGTKLQNLFLVEFAIEEDLDIRELVELRDAARAPC